MNFQSEFYKDADELVQAKNDAFSKVEERKKRLKIIRRFSNGLATLSKKEAERLGRKEITNHLTTYSKLLQQETQFKSMVTGTNAVLEVIVDTDNPEQDLITGMRLSEAINRGALHHKGRFANFWRKVSGEIVMAGGAPVTMNPQYGWLPKVSIDMFFPKKTSLDSEEITLAFEPMELTYADLKEMLASISGKEGHIHDKQNIMVLIKALKRQLEDNTKEGSGFGENEVTQAAREAQNQLNNATIDAWVYFEVKFRENGDRYVSKTIFTDAMQTTGAEGQTKYRISTGEEDVSSARIITYIEEAFNTPDEWLHLVCVDSEIGGDKNTDSLRGVAELMYPSGAEMEELLNLLLEGDKIRARPKMRLTSEAKADDVAKWDLEQDTYAPSGVEELEIKSNAQHLQTPFHLLDRNASNITGAPVANTPRGGELRQQAVERQDVNAGVQSDRVSEAGNQLDAILDTVVWRLLAGDVKEGTEGYHETMWVRKKLEQSEVDYKKLAERENGRFKWIRVRARRTIGNGDRVQQIETADWMMENITSIEPASRPHIIQSAFALRTQDPDLAERIIRPPQVILNQQRVIAENEWDTISRRAMIGQSISPQPDDIHHNHIDTHFLDMQALLGKDEVPGGQWSMTDAIIYAAGVQHTGEHIQILIANPATNFEGNRYLQEFQKLVQAAKPIVTRLQADEQSEQNQLTPKEQADVELALARLELDAHALGLKEEDLRDLQKIRQSRSALSNRQQYVREVNEGRRLQMDEKKLALDAVETKSDASDDN